MIKSALPLLILLACMLNFSPVHGQDKKLTFTFEYSPNASNVSGEIRGDFKFSQMGMARLTFNTGKISPTVGLGYFNIGSINYFENIGTGILEHYKYYNNLNYVILPVGLRLSLGKFFILPEVAIGKHVSTWSRVIATFSDGTYYEEKFKINGDGSLIQEFTYPLFLSVGRDFQIGKISLMAGLKGYLGLDDVFIFSEAPNQYYGFGAMVGINL